MKRFKPYALPSSARGLTLLEVMISCALLIIGVVAVTMVLGSSNLLTLRQKKLTRGLQLGEALMEELLLLDSDDEDLTPGEHEFCYDEKHRIVDPCDGYEDGLRPDLFRANWQSQLNRPVVGSRYIRLEIFWVEKWGEKKITFHTYRN